MEDILVDKRIIMSIIAIVGLELMEHIYLCVYMSTIKAMLDILQTFLGVLGVVSKIKYR